MINSFLARLRGNQGEEKVNQLGFLLDELIEGESYEIGQPWQLVSGGLSAVVPIVKKLVQDRDYLVLQEIPKERISVLDSGRIGKISVSLKGVEKPVFVRAGTVFKGHGTQSRTSGIGVILRPGEENLVDVFCVHASHRISTCSSFSISEDTVPRKVEDVLLSPFKSQTRVWGATAVKGFRARITQCPECGSSRLLQTYEAQLVCMECGYLIAPMSRSDPGKRRTTQIRVGAPSTIASYNRGLSARFNWSARGNLVANLHEMRTFNREVERTLSKIPANLDNQIGIVMIDSHGVLGLEMVDHPDSWQAFSHSIVRNYADVLAKERAKDDLFELKTDKVPEAIKKFFEKAQKLSETSVFKNSIGETKMLLGELTGEYTTLGSNVIHLILKRKTIA